MLGRNADPALNGGVRIDYVYTGFGLANGEDEVLLIAPDETQVDRAVWGDEPTMPGGASLERTAFNPARWQAASTGWPGSVQFTQLSLK